MRKFLPVLSLAALAACQSPVPDDTLGGVGFGDYATYQQQREAQLTAQRNSQIQTVQPPASYASPVAEGTGYAGAVPAGGAPTAGELAAAGIGQGTLDQAAVAPLPPAVSPAIPDVGATETGLPPAGAAAPATPVLPQTPAPAESHAGISDEQDFNAVASRETIESDKARMEQNRAQYQQVQPTELPERTDEATAAVDLVQYALNAPNRKGETVYPRSRIALSSAERNCARYDTPEAAQQAFLRSGGPGRDPKNLDPDGDGFACFWDPTPFQKAKQ